MHEWVVARQHLVQDDAEAPHVGLAATVGTRPHHLGRDVGGRPAAVADPLAGGDDVGISKIAQPDALKGSVDEHGRQFEVAQNNVVRVARLDGAHELHENSARLALGQGRGSNKRHQSGAPARFGEEQKHIFFRFNNIDDPAELGRVAERGSLAGLVHPAGNLMKRR